MRLTPDDLRKAGDEEDRAQVERIHGYLEALDDLDDRERVRRIGAEVLSLFHALSEIGPALAVFGSARPGPARRWGASIRRTTELLARAGLSIITGGGPSLMEAANQGAREGQATSIGLTIDLPEERGTNPHVGLEVPFHYFFLRKFAFVKYACAFVCFPGGFGTLDELFEALNLVKTHRMASFPVILFGSEYWNGLVRWLNESVVHAGGLTSRDLDLIEVVDRPEAVVDRVANSFEQLSSPDGPCPGGT